MTNYKLEEFKAWLEEKPERKENLPLWNIIFEHMGDGFERFLQNQFYTAAKYNLYHQVAQEWKQEVDQERERERERERESNRREEGIICQ